MENIEDKKKIVYDFTTAFSTGEFRNIKFKKYKKLEELIITTNFNELKELPNTLNKLVCKKCSIQELKIDNLISLKIFDCSINYLKQINLKKLKNLIHLNCSKNKLNNIVNIPKTVKKIICSYNKIILLNDLPEDLEILDLSYNLIKNLENLPSKL